MIEKLVKVKEILNVNPKTSRKVWEQESGLNYIESAYLIKNGYILKNGSTKGATWEWNSQEPDYLMETAVLSGIQSDYNQNDESEQSEEQLPNDATIMDVFKHHNIKFSIGNGMSVRFINNSEIELRKNNGRSIRIDNASKLNELLCFLN
jgi:hypothetical protein